MVATAWLACAVPARAQTFPLVGEVRGPTGEPVAAATVEARYRIAPELPGLCGWTLGGPDAIGCARVDVSTDDDGRFRIELPVRGPVVLVARTDAGMQSLRVFPVMAGSFRELRLAEPAMVSGVVVDAEGKPFADLDLVLEPDPSTWTRLAVHGVPLSRRHVRTDADGRFEHALEHAYLSAAMHEPFVVLRPTDPTLGFRRESPLRPLPEVASLELAALPRDTIDGVVHDVRGKPIAGALLRSTAAPWWTAVSGADGRFALPWMRRGGTAVFAEGQSLRILPYGYWRTAGETGAEVGLMPGRRLEALLVDGAGDVLAERDVLWSIDCDEGPPFELRGRTDAEGRIVLENAPVLTTTSGYVHTGGRWRRFVHRRVQKDQDLGRVAVTWRKLEGHVVDARGVPVAGARVVACEDVVDTGLAPSCWVTFTDHGGRYRFSSLPRTAFRLMAEASAHGFAAAAAAEEVNECRLQFVAGSTLRVQVFDSDGAEAAGCWVALVGRGGIEAGLAPSPVLTQSSIFGITGENGWVSFAGLPDQSWLLLAQRLDGGRLEVANESVAAGVDEFRIEIATMPR